MDTSNHGNKFNVGTIVGFRRTINAPLEFGRINQVEVFINVKNTQVWYKLDGHDDTIHESDIRSTCAINNLVVDDESLDI